MPSSEHSSPTERPSQHGQARDTVTGTGAVDIDAARKPKPPNAPTTGLYALSLDSLSADAPITRVFTTYRPRFILRAVRVVIQ